MNDIKLRIRNLIKNSGYTIDEFANKIGTHQSSLSRALAEKNNVGDAMINKISIAFDINKDWLLTGEGEMLKQEIKGAYALNEPLNYNDMGKDENSTLKELLYSFKEIAESVKINAVANERNSRNMEAMIEMIREERKKGEKNPEVSNKEISAQTG